VKGEIPLSLQEQKNLKTRIVPILPNATTEEEENKQKQNHM
jgi:hypothetical protein